MITFTMNASSRKFFFSMRMSGKKSEISIKKLILYYIKAHKLQHVFLSLSLFLSLYIESYIRIYY